MPAEREQPVTSTICEQFFPDKEDAVAELPLSNRAFLVDLSVAVGIWRGGRVGASERVLRFWSGQSVRADGALQECVGLA